MWLIVWVTWILGSGAYTASGSCKFPPKWTGSWFQKGVQPIIKIERDKISSKGVCRDFSGDLFLLEDSRENCFRCVVIYEKHPNVLQYRETFCDEHRTLELACARLNVDAHLYTLFRKDGSPIPCPFRGPFTFTYNRGQKECRFPVSQVDICSEESKLLFRFQACPDVSGTEMSIEELTCLAVWKEGPSLYMVGNMNPVNFPAPDSTYRCFVYEYLPDKNGYQVSQSADATCDGLISPSEGSRIMKLAQSPRPQSGCLFPSLLTSVKRWTTLDGLTQYDFSDMGDTVRIGSDLKLTCSEEIVSEDNSTTILTYASQRCRNGFVCIAFHLRDNHVAEVQLGQLSKRHLEACSPPYSDWSAPFVTIVAETDESYLCPQLVETNGLKIQAGKVTLATDVCGDSSALVVGCRSSKTLQFLTTCASVKDLMTFQCHGKWEEEGKTYLIAGLQGSQTKYCLVYNTNQQVTQLSGLYDTCHRSTLPGVTGNFTFNITAAGECEYLLSKSTRHEPFYAVLLLVSLLNLLLR